LQQQPRRSRRRIDDELARLARNQPAAVRKAGTDAARQIGAENPAHLAAALGEPIQARTLRVEIGDRRGHVAGREKAGEVRGDRALADATLRVDHQCRIHRHLAASLRPYGSAD
jgi:hypothetical protein